MQLHKQGFFKYLLNINSYSPTSLTLTNINTTHIANLYDTRPLPKVCLGNILSQIILKNISHYVILGYIFI